MTKEFMPNGDIRLSSERGIIDLRNGQRYSSVICKPKNDKYFIEDYEDAEAVLCREQ